jgi:hypothetical protein
MVVVEAAVVVAGDFTEEAVGIGIDGVAVVVVAVTLIQVVVIVVIGIIEEEGGGTSRHLRACYDDIALMISVVQPP